MMKASIRIVGAQYNTHRMLEDYCRELYFPAARHYLRLSAADSAQGQALSEWWDRIRGNWGGVRIVSTASTPEGSLPVTTDVQVAASVALGALSPDDVAVQVYYGVVGADGALESYDVAPMAAGEAGSDGVYTFTGTIHMERSGLHGFTVRVSPRHPDLSESHAAELAVWSS